MMVLHAAGSGTEQAPARTAMQKNPLRRRRSKGTIAGFAFGKSNVANAASSEPLNGNERTENTTAGGRLGPGKQGTASPAGSPNQPQHAAESSATAPTSKPCCAARLALLCAQNAVRMGARTQLNLCPPGRARRDLQTQLRQRVRTQQKNSSFALRLVGNAEVGGYFGLDKLVGADTLEDFDAQEEDFLISTNTYNMDSDEEASSGDDDDLIDLNDQFSDEPISLEEDRYSSLREPLFTPAGADSLSSANGAQMSSGNAAGKLPFNRRKIRYFDLVAAPESTTARAYLQDEMRRYKRRSGLMLTRHLRRVQREEMRRKRQEAGEPTGDLADSDTESPEEKALLHGGVSRLETAMTPAISAALLIESLSINKTESIEGMAKCYDGIVNAGVALLEAHSIDPTKPAGSDEKVRATRSEIMAALTPWLITSLEQPSGEVILALAKLRRMCGSQRYQRRFVQRVAPALIRPKNGAMWCLRHQNDMEAILAAAELIFDAAFEVFSSGWYESGQLMLADSKRAETLNAAAMQLRSLSSEPTDGFVRGLAAGARRRLISGSKMKQDAGKTSEPLAEWEVIAVDQQIRISINNVITNDWSRTSIHTEAPKPSYRRSAHSRRTAGLLQSPSTDLSLKSILASPRSPPRTANLAQGPHSPPHMPAMANLSSTGTDMDSCFGPPFANQPFAVAERAISPPPSNVLPSSPQPTNKKENSRSQLDINTDTSQTPINAQTPPRSPRSPKKTEIDVGRTLDLPPGRNPLSPRSPKPIKSRSTAPSAQMIVPEPSRPMSPSASIGTASDMVSYRPSVASSVSAGSSPGATPTSQYRTLTSTAAERKRTVAACRALRAQIQRFEEAFFQLHGRAPKGAAERAPLATTYAQYREWKRAIRADAACRIQALFRGARTRWRLLRDSNQAFTRVVLRRAGRPGEVPDLSIPMEIGQSEQQNSFAMGQAADGSFAGRSGSNQMTAPQWPSQHIQPRSSGGDRLAGDFGSPPAPRPYSPMAAPQGSPELANLTLSELQARKRDLKQQLKQYDMNFARRHGRMPVKAEKEPIRHLYESYNALKSQISLMEQEGRHLQPSGTSSSTPAAASAAAAAAAASQSARAISPTTGSESGASGGEDSPARVNSPVLARNKRKVPKAAFSPLAKAAPEVAAPAPTTTSVGTAATSSTDLAALKAEKGQLHQMLRSYEKDFFKENKRQVSSFADIKPVASQYRRYKEIKKSIQALQQQQQQQQQQER